MERVRVYVDGFNLYFGMRAKHGRRLHWLDLEHLAESLLKPRQELVQVYYFTARVRNEPPAEQRQSVYLDALLTHSTRLHVVAGQYQRKQRRCSFCGARWTVYEEKETDVNIAVTLLEDAALDRFDTAIVVSADSDLCPAVRAVRRVAPGKRLIAAFPPRRRSSELRRHVHASFTISDAKLRQAHLPRTVPGPGNVTFERPEHWT